MDLRDYLEILDSKGMLLKIDGEVDWNLEAACIATMLYRVSNGRHAILFENVKGYSPEGGRLVSCIFSPNRRRFWDRTAIAMGLPDDTPYHRFREEFLRRSKKLIKPNEISQADALCKEVIKVGKEANLLDFPIPFLHANDGGRYLTMLGIVNKHPDTGWMNVGNYRWMVKGPRRGAALFVVGQQGPNIHLVYEMRGESCSFCIYVGGDPLNFMVAVAGVPEGVCEYDVLGGLRDKPIEVVRAETNDILIPADAELVIEGEIRPGERTDEGPFGEYTGFTHGRNISPIFRVQCITHRKNPIIPFTVEGAKWNDGVGGSLFGMGSGWAEYVADLGINVYDCWPANNIDAAGGLIPCYIDALTPDEPLRFAHATFSYKATFAGLMSVIICDANIDPTDTRDAFEALGMSCDPRRQIFITDRDTYNYPLVFYTDAAERFKNIGAARVAYDATVKFKPWAEKIRRSHFEASFPEDMQRAVKDEFGKWGFDEPFEEKRVLTKSYKKQ